VGNPLASKAGAFREQNRPNGRLPAAAAAAHVFRKSRRGRRALLMAVSSSDFIDAYDFDIVMLNVTEDKIK
jgi:hypothetical protein